MTSFWIWAFVIPVLYWLIMDKIDERLALQFIVQKDEKPSACLIYLHGLGKTGDWQRNQFRELMGDNVEFPHLKMIFPTSLYKYCEQRKGETYTWFDLKLGDARDRNSVRVVPDDVESSLQYIDHVIKLVIDSGIPADRILLGGVSQGAMIALLYGYTRQTNIRGIISHSGFFLKDYEDKFRSDPHLPSLFFANFDGDRVVPYPVAKESFEFFASKRVIIESHLYSGGHHEVDKEMLTDTYRWIQGMVPPKL